MKDFRSSFSILSKWYSSRKCAELKADKKDQLVRETPCFFSPHLELKGLLNSI